ncbi:MAG: prolipoprotein diacylglyceryl transferase [Cardiobacteriaceae bacterium]|nr:prolipoprotein diacylglyceryl transferase [Cardiobacteriaceae bacterium]
MAIILPEIDPAIIHIGKIAPTWYGAMYALGFLSGYFLALKRAVKYPHLSWNKDNTSDLLFYLMLGVIIGGRLGYILFYRVIPFGINTVISDPLSIFRVWEGGMSFHGGLLGVFIACLIFAFKYNKKVLDIGDFIAPFIPLGLFFGRIGNFINGELYGRETNLPWAMIFPQDKYLLPRHPSQLYEAFWEGLVLFTVLNIYIYRKKAKYERGMLVGMFLAIYAVGRFFIEFIRLKDAQMSYYLGMTMGQVLCLPMLLIGGYLIYSARQKEIAKN